ncbi:MAG TPA: hypothetical protein VHF47_11635 [Acidimicrobiales bacterium]|nr:hypothetical protein [Acidimicrobiales bacterium]
MPRRRPGSARRPLPLLSRYPITVDAAVALARAAACEEPAFVVLSFDDEGILLAVGPHDVALSELEASCATLLHLLAPEGRGPAVVASVDPGFGCDVAPALAVWPDLVHAFEEAGATLLDWLLVCDDRVSSVAAAAGTPAGW